MKSYWSQSASTVSRRVRSSTLPVAVDLLVRRCPRSRRRGRRSRRCRDRRECARRGRRGAAPGGRAGVAPGGGRSGGGVSSPAGASGGAGTGAGSPSSAPAAYPGANATASASASGRSRVGTRTGTGREGTEADANIGHSSVPPSLAALRRAMPPSASAVRCRPAAVSDDRLAALAAFAASTIGTPDFGLTLRVGRRELPPLFPHNAWDAVAWTRDTDRNGCAAAAGGLPAVRACGPAARDRRRACPDGVRAGSGQRIPAPDRSR